MEFEVDRIFEQAHDVLSVYCEEYETPEECLLRHFPKEDFTEPASIFEFRIKPFEIPVYVICCQHEYTVHMLVATKKDAEETGNFVMIDEIESLRKRKASFN